MSFNLRQSLEQFRSFAGALEVIDADILRFIPRKSSGLKIGILGLVHGNEVVGLPIINSLLADLTSGRIESHHEIYFALGNLPAAHANRRFVDKDLNRCFGQGEISTEEDRRARLLESKMLNHVDYLIDLHQTVQPAKQPFFIFQYSSPECFQHLAMMNPGIPTILQFEAIGDSQSLSTDEYVRGRGRFGVALELGQLGFNDQAFDLGRSICTRFLTEVNARTEYRMRGKRPTFPSYPFFAITDRMKAEVDTHLLPGFQNFVEFESGEVLGTSKAGQVLTDQSGFVLFPKLNQFVARGETLFHVCQPLGAEEVASLANSEILALPVVEVLAQV